MCPTGRRLSNSKVSFETAVRSHLLASIFYGADDRFIRKAECWLSGRCLIFLIFYIWISDLSFRSLDFGYEFLFLDL